MALVQQIFFYLASTAFFFGPTLRVNLFLISIPIFDFLLSIYLLSSFLYKPKLTNKYAVYFVLWSFYSYFLNLKNYGFIPTNFIYLIKLSNICILLFLSPKISKIQQKFFIIIIWANIIFGFIQYYFWPDLTNYKYFGWDPHLNRLTSTFLDPTFTALIFLFLLINYYFYSTKTYLLIPIYISIALTYSRSTLVSLSLSSLYISIFRNKNLILFSKTVLLILITILLLPNRIGEGTNLKRTSTIKAKIENYKQALTSISQSPIIGHGYNNLPSYKTTSSQTPDHSLSGYDSSLLTITSTTGLIGLVLFLNALKLKFEKSNLSQKTALVSLITHSLFANSLLYSWAIFTYFALFETKNHK